MRIEVDDLTWTRRRTRVLDSLCLTLRPGTVTGLVGPTGSGKTVTVKAMLGLIRAKGRVTYDGTPLTRHPVAARVVGVHFADAGLHPDRRVRDHLRMVAAAAGLDRHRVDEIIEFAGLTDLARSRPREMSRAMDHLIGVASALLPDPAALIVDGPLDGIDDETRTWLHEVLRARADAGGTVLVTDRSRGAVEGICDRVVALHQGRLDDVTGDHDTVAADIRGGDPVAGAAVGQSDAGESSTPPVAAWQESAAAAQTDPGSAPEQPASPASTRAGSAAERSDGRAQEDDSDMPSATTDPTAEAETGGAADIRERSVSLRAGGSRPARSSAGDVDVTADTDDPAAHDTDPDGRDDVDSWDGVRIPEQREVRLSEEVAGHHVPAKSGRSRRKSGSRRRSRSGGSRRGGSR